MNKKIILLFLAICLVFSDDLSAQVEKEIERNVPAAKELFKTGLKKARKGEYQESLADFHASANLYKQELGEEHRKVGGLYVFIGDIERRSGRYDTALAYYKRAENILLCDEEKNISRIISMYNGYGICYRHFRKFDKSLNFYFESLRLTTKEYGDNHFQVGYTYNNIANTYGDLGDVASEVEFLRLSKDILEVRFADNRKQLSNVYNNYGRALMDIKRYEEAEIYFQKATEAQEEVGNQSPVLADGYNRLGMVNLAKGQGQEAISYFEKSFKTLGLLNFSEEYFYNVNSPEICLEAFSGLSRTYNTEFEKTKEEQALIEGKKITDLALGYIKYLKTDFREINSRKVIMRKSFPIYEQAITIALNSNHSKEENFITAFNYSEKSRNNFLRDAVQEQNAKEFVGIPDSILVVENSLKERLAKMEKKKNDEEIGGAGRLEISELEKEILELKEEYNNLIASYEKDYPDYYTLKYATAVISVEEIKSDVLKKGETLLEYFVGDNNLFAFVITKENTEVVKIAKDFSLDNRVKNMRESIFEWRPRSENAEENVKKYQENALFLYQKLISPIENLLTDNIIIIPGGVLGYLPFEALLSEKIEDNSTFSDYPYWIKEKQISYNYSATLFKEMLKERNTGREVLALAPSFGTIDSDSLPFNLPKLKALKHNENEVNAIKDLLGGLALTGEDATLQAFKDIAPLYKILHLATHGKANDEDEEYSYLAFTYLLDTLDNELLYTSDLYNMELRADLIVLSACETGIGELQQGEGVMSLARGFSYAGAKSIVTTLWSIDDKASLEIMVKFYKNLENGKRKDYALRQSKLDFITNNTRRSHPLYWAAYVPIGNMESIAIGRESNFLLLAAVFSSILLVFFWGRNNVKKKRKTTHHLESN